MSILQGEETAVRLAGSLWPALVGAAFDQGRDLVANVAHNCIIARNTLQVDADEDGFGDACDADLTGDSVVNFADLAVMKRAFFRKPGPSRLACVGMRGEGAKDFSRCSRRSPENLISPVAPKLFERG